MKLGKCAAALVVTSFLLTGCQNGSKTVKEDGKYRSFFFKYSDKEKNIFADDVFDDVISTASGKSAYFNAVLQQLIDQKFPVDEDMETDADEHSRLKSKLLRKSYGEDAEESLNQR